jgi:PAS domain-containing protein
MDRTNRSRTDLNSLWEKLSDLKSLESDLSDQISHTMPERTSEQIKSAIEDRLGFLPPHLVPALQSPLLLESLWRQHLSSYMDNPLPELFKERLAIRLSRYCASPYFIVLHACTLIQLGVEAEQVQKLIEDPLEKTPGDPEQFHTVLAEAPHPLESWPEDNAAFEESVFAGCSSIFAGREDAERWAAELKDVLGPSLYSHLAALLAFIKSSHLWVESHPDINYEDHPTVTRNYLSLVQAEPRLVDSFQNYRSVFRQNYPGAYYAGDNANTQYREFFENANDIIYTHDFEGNLISINRAAERITGYTQAEILRMKITDPIAPGYRDLAEKMLDPRMAGELPLSYESHRPRRQHTPRIPGR